jgi:hypothetical protein
MILQWTLNVEGFGKIENASVRISPLMIFAGDNNSGKSYIMSLLWGILMLQEFTFLPNDISTTDAYKNCVEWLKCHQGEEEVEIDQPTIRLFFDLFNLILDTHKNRLVKDIFNADIPIKSIRLSDECYHVPVLLKQSFERNSSFWSVYDTNSAKFIINLPSDDTTIDFGIYSLCYKICLGNLSSFIRGAIYLPASRTGFMLTYKALASKALRFGFQHGSEDKTSMGKLTAPVSHFLSDLVKINLDSKSRFSEVATFLEDHILQGTIKKDQSPVPNYLFKPKDSEDELSLHVTSSLVAELSPIVLYLKSNEMINTMIIEEPEAHLHPEMQRYIARAMVRLVNQGLPIWITTHSDTLVQQINNLIKLNNNSHRQELSDQYGYEEHDFLDPEKVRVYQFMTQPNRSIVQVQPLTSNGFSFPTFTESITKLTKETIDFMENDNDEEDD